MDETRTLYRATLAAILILPIAVYLATASALGGRYAIEIGNAGLLAFAAGIVTAYAVPALNALRAPAIRGSDVLVIGILVSWTAVLIARSVSIVWRLMGQDPSWLNSTGWGLHIAIATAGALCHLVAPQAISGRVPARGLIRIGVWVAVAVFIASATLVLSMD